MKLFAPNTVVPHPGFYMFTIVHKLNSIKKSNEIDERHRKNNEHLT